MAKTVNNPKEKMRMNIELADNGIIIRNLECKDDVTLATSHQKTDAYLPEVDHEDEYKALGKKIFDWLYNNLLGKEADFIVTNFDIDVIATCKGRPFNKQEL